MGFWVVLEPKHSTIDHLLRRTLVRGLVLFFSLPSSCHDSMNSQICDLVYCSVPTSYNTNYFPFSFTEWDVVYCSVPTSPGGGYRSALGRLIFKTSEMIQVIQAPDTVRNKVSFCAFGFFKGEVSLEGNWTP